MEEENNSIENIDEIQKINEIPLAWLLTNQLNRIIFISSQEFHPAIKLYSDQGMLRAYLQDVLESYGNAVGNLRNLLLGFFPDAEFNKEINSIENVVFDDKKDYFDSIYLSCLKLIVRRGIVSNVKKDLLELI